jgi:hypothetical protein
LARETPLPTAYRYHLLALDVLLFGYLVWFRTHGLSETFWLYADQVRDWTIALKPFGDLPLVGPPSLAGGNTVGPIYYWILWLFARVIGPFCDYLPHAGGVGTAILLSAADAALFHALAVRLKFTALALAIVLVVATAGPDATVSGTIWNPPVAIALMKIGMATALLLDARRMPNVIAATAILWLAVQAHTTVLPVVIAILLWLVAFLGWRVVVSRAAVIALVIALLQAPWLIDRVGSSGFSTETPMGQSVSAAVRDPLGALRPLESTTALLRAVAANVPLSVPLPVVGAVLAAGAIALVVVGDSCVSAIAVAPLFCTIVLFAIWQGPLTENYWYLANAPSAALCVLGWIAAIPQRARMLLASVALLVAIAAQPAQAQYTWTTLRTPAYGALVRASYRLKQSGVPVRDITTTFAIPPDTSPAFIFSILGGQLDPSAGQRAVFGPSGQLLFEAVDRLAPR